MNAKKKQYGKGIGGFIFGLLLATLVIGGILYFLNGDKTKYNEVSKPQELPKPEILTPASSGMATASAVSEVSIVSDVEASAEILGAEEPPASDAGTPSDSATTAEETGTAPVVAPPVLTTSTDEQQRLAEEKRRTEQAKQERLKQQAAQKAREAEAAKKAQTETEVKKTETKPAAKPTPEQILNSGSLEKAQKEASAKQPAVAPSSGGRVIVQMGSYNNEQAAEAQRAKLAMIGVSANVVQATANGKTVYRVQSGRLNKDAAEGVSKTLQQNGVASFTRAAQ